MNNRTRISKYSNNRYNNSNNKSNKKIIQIKFYKQKYMKCKNKMNKIK